MKPGLEMTALLQSTLVFGGDYRSLRRLSPLQLLGLFFCHPIINMEPDDDNSDKEKRQASEA